jgi:hypothetical protein
MKSNKSLQCKEEIYLVQCSREVCKVGFLGTSLGTLNNRDLVIRRRLEKQTGGKSRQEENIP